MAPPEVIRLNLRLPKALHRRLTKEAKANHVSLNTQIVNALEGVRSEQVEVLTVTLRKVVDEIMEKERAVRTPDDDREDAERRKASETPDDGRKPGES